MRSNIKNKIVYYHIDGLHDITVGYADHPNAAAHKLLKTNYPHQDTSYTFEVVEPFANPNPYIIWLQVKNPLFTKECFIKLTRI